VRLTNEFPTAKQLKAAFTALGKAIKNADLQFKGVALKLKKSKHSKSYLKREYYQNQHKDRTPHYRQNVGKSKRW